MAFLQLLQYHDVTTLYFLHYNDRVEMLDKGCDWRYPEVETQGLIKKKTEINQSFG